MSKSLSISWEQFHLNTLALVKKLKKYEFNRIIVVSRGGLVPASIIASELDIRYVDTICYQSYNNNKQSSIELIKRPLVLNTLINPKTLIIDDITDTGKTFKTIDNLNKNTWPLIWPTPANASCFASVYTKPQGKEFINEFAVEVDQDVWVEFPWEKIGI